MTRRRSRGRPRDQGAPSERTWQRIDLHLHTPGSSDYQDPRATYLEILQRAEARGLDIIAFTDHNSVAGYAAMMREIEHLEFLEAGGRILSDEAHRLYEYRRLREKVLVLPGFEFTATFGFHILGIFPEGTSIRKLEHVLLQLNVPEDKLDRGTSEVGATTDVLKAYEIIADAGGLVIGAHVNSTHGIAMIGLGFGGQTKIAYTQDPNLHALEVTDLDAHAAGRRSTARFFNGSKPEYPRRMHCIQGSDAHRLTRDPQRPEKNLGVGDRCTEVFIAETSFDALKALFASTEFGHTRPYRPSEDPFDPLTEAREEGNTIVQSFHDAPGPPRARVKSLLKDVVAFANTNGGVLYIGASADARQPIQGTEGAAELADLLRAEALRQVVPPLAIDVETLTREDKTVLVVSVPKGTETPYALEPGYIYVRQEGETALALRDEIVQLVRANLDLPASASVVGPSPSSPFLSRAHGNGAPRPAPAGAGAPPSAPHAIAPPGPAQRPNQQGQQAGQQAAVRQAEAAEQDRQQERVPVPRTGVEIIASVERNGLVYHTVRDLRNRRVVRNVTRESARRLWRYAVLQAEQHAVRPEDVRWDERDPRLGYWKGYRQPEGMRRYNLAYREQPAAEAAPPDAAPEAGNGRERLRVFYGVTEDGIDERWRPLLPPDSELTEIYYDEPTVAAEPPAAPAPSGDAAARQAEPAHAPAPGEAALAPAVTIAPGAERAGDDIPGGLTAPAGAPVQHPPAPTEPAAVVDAPVAEPAADTPPARPKRRRAPRRKAAGDPAETPAPVAPEPKAAVTAMTAPATNPATPAPTPQRRRSKTAPSVSAAGDPASVAAGEGGALDAPNTVPEASDTPAPKRPARRRRTPGAAPADPPEAAAVRD